MTLSFLKDHISQIPALMLLLGITVTPEGKVLLNAPIGTPREKIEEKLLKRARWIVK